MFVNEALGLNLKRRQKENNLGSSGILANVTLLTERITVSSAIAASRVWFYFF